MSVPSHRRDPLAWMPAALDLSTAGRGAVRITFVWALLIPLLGVATVVDQRAAQAGIGYHTTDDVSGRTAAIAAPSPLYGIPRNSYFQVICQVLGEPVGPRSNTLYFLTSFDGRTLFVPDTWTDSPHLAGQPPIPGIPMCSSTRLPSGPLQGTGNPVPKTEQVVSRDCGGAWLGWAEYRDYGDRIKMKLRPTKRAWAAMGTPLVRPLWDSFFRCISWDDGFDRLTQSQWDSLWLQHRCHVSLGIIGRAKSGDTFDYESWSPRRRDLRDALGHGCN